MTPVFPTGNPPSNPPNRAVTDPLDPSALLAMCDKIDKRAMGRLIMSPSEVRTLVEALQLAREALVNAHHAELCGVSYGYECDCGNVAALAALDALVSFGDPT